LIVSAGENV
jgi:acyl-CoA synthetase (AMP-forming)/AMP-acid ligase II